MQAQSPWSSERILTFGLGIVYLVAFSSLWVQIHGLIGPDGIMPIHLRPIEPIHWSVPNSWAPYLNVFRLLGGSRTSLHIVCLLGVLSSTSLILHRFPRMAVSLLWLLYYSVFQSAAPFLAYQWDILLLETSILAVFAEPDAGARVSASKCWQQIMSGRSWLFRLVLFKLMWLSGLVKVSNQDPNWIGLSALDFHFWTQPIPHLGGYFAYHLGPSARQAGVFATHFVELGLPWLLLFSLSKPLSVVWTIITVPMMIWLLPEQPVHMTFLVGCYTLGLWVFERIRTRNFTVDKWGLRAAGWLMMALMLMIVLSGNYGFFNLLTVVVILAACFGRTLTRGYPNVSASAPPRLPPTMSLILNGALLLFLLTANLIRIGGSMHQALSQAKSTQSNQTVSERSTVSDESTVWTLVVDLNQKYQRHFSRLVLVNTYGLFARMTTERYELTIEGSHDRARWKSYRFNYKPNELNDLNFAGLHMPRLDWQMWFAALYPECSQRWIFFLMDALFLNDKDVLTLLKHNPFSDQAPTFLRITKQRRKFAVQREESQNFWEAIGETQSYCPVVDRNALLRSQLTRTK